MAIVEINEIDAFPVTVVEKNGFPVYVTNPSSGGGGITEETDPIWQAEKSQYAKLTDIPAETDPVWNSEKINYVLKSELSDLGGLTRDITYGPDALLAEDGTTLQKDILIAFAPKTGNYRLYLTGGIIRTGGSNAIGTLELQLIVNGVVKTSGTFEVFRDMNSIKTLVTAESFDLSADDEIRINAKYTTAGTETVTTSGVKLGVDII